MVGCPACSAANPDSALFCAACGASLTAGSDAGAALGGEARAPVVTTVPGRPLSAELARDSALAGPSAGAWNVVPAPLAGSIPRRAPGGHLPAGTLIDQKYVIEGVLGEGGMGVVYLARDVHTGLHVVLKAVRQELAHRPDVRARMLAEGRALAQIDHPNVVHLKAIVAERDELWLVMQYIDGESLEQRIARHVQEGRPMPLSEALSLFRQVASGIAAAHGEGVIHRDLKPANVLIRGKDAVAKVTDFGIAKAEADALAGRGLTRGIIGSLYYMSPEQVTGRRDLDKRVDIYALGVVLYEMLVGQVPFDADSDQEIMRLHAQAPIPRVSDKRPDVPAEIDAIIQKACAKDRADRFASCEEMLSALDAAARPWAAASPPPHASSRPPPVDAANHAPWRAGPSPASTAPSVPPPARPADARAGRRWLPVSVALSALVLAGGAAALLGAFRLAPKGGGRTRPDPPATRPPGAPSASSAGGAPSASGPQPSPLASLTGRWIGNGRELDAVLVGDALEFRILRAEQFAPQDYIDGEARFSLREIDGETRIFAVEDRLRFIAPGARSFDPARSRGTCQDMRTLVDGRPLRASYDGERLSVEFARIEPTARNFVIERNRVVSCVGLSALPATRVVSTLSRP